MLRVGGGIEKKRRGGKTKILIATKLPFLIEGKSLGLLNFKILRQYFSQNTLFKVVAFKINATGIEIYFLFYYEQGRGTKNTRAMIGRIMARVCMQSIF